jgi:hypothetical protein
MSGTPACMVNRYKLRSARLVRLALRARMAGAVAAPTLRLGAAFCRDSERI